MIDKKERLLTVGIVTLIVVAAGLGYLIYGDYNLGSKINSYLDTKSEEAKQDSQASTSLQSELPNDAQGVLNFPSDDASEEERRRHTDLVDKLAVETNVLEIADCEPTPLVIMVSEEESINIKNTGDVSHTIQSGDFEIFLPANGEKVVEVKSIAEFGLGSYGYNCDGVLEGVINVIP